MSVTITRDEWLTELERVMRQQRPDSDGMSAEELAAAWKVCKRVALERLNLLRDRVIVGQRRVTAISGRMAVCPTYKLAPLATRKKAARRR